MQKNIVLKIDALWLYENPWFPWQPSCDFKEANLFLRTIFFFAKWSHLTY